MQILRLIIFLSIFTAVYLGLHYFALGRLSHYFALPNGRTFYMSVLILGLFFPVAAVLERTLGLGSTRILYICASILMGMLTIFIGLIAIYELMRAILPPGFVPAPSYLIVLLFVLTAYGTFNARGFAVREITVPIPNLNEPMDLVQLSDIHTGTINRSGYLNALTRTINTLKPAAVLITGDLFDGSAPLDANSILPLDDLTMPVFLSLGNHELYEGLSHVEKTLSGTKIRLLRNEMVGLNDVQIIGIDNPAKETRRDLPALKNIQFDPKRPTILMYHPPTGMQDAEKAGVDLQLSGHTHHGQIFPFSLLALAFYRYGFGLHHFGNLTLYTSPGSGTWGPPMRIGSKNEITLFHVTPETARTV